jgi:S-adenosylmethionine hydrolase
MGRTVAMISDFSYSDNYVGIMKGVIRSISHFADIIDITHGVEPGNIQSAAYSLGSAYKFFPKNTVFLCVVDPKVGTARNAIAIETENYFFVAPDNGILSPIIKSEKIISSVILNNEKYHLKNKSNTFHGRDIFAPVAAYISIKVELAELGEPTTPRCLTILDDIEPTVNDDGVSGKIIHIDSFGNLVTNVNADDLKKKDIRILVADYEINGISNTYADVKENELLAYIGSSGMIEIASNKANAKQITGLKNGSSILISYL